MISLTQIKRMISHGSYGQLIRRILSNGRCTCPVIREHLLGSPGGPDTPIAACGLALQRCCELSYLPTDLAGELARRLTAMQMPDGRFGIADDTALAATAIALRGLIEYRDQLDSVGGGGNVRRDVGGGDVGNEDGGSDADDTVRKLDAAIERGLHAVTRLMNTAAVTSDHATSILIAVWQLGHLPVFRSRINVGGVLARLREQHARDLDARLIDYAYAQAA